MTAGSRGPDRPTGFTVPCNYDCAVQMRLRCANYDGGGVTLNIPRMKIPVFVSAPSPDNLSPGQEESARMILKLVRTAGFEWRALGRSDYPHELPLREVIRMIRHCSGGIILGFEQVHVTGGQVKRGSPHATGITVPLSMPTPWNQIEAALLFAAKLPVMIFREPGVVGGVFDVGTTELFIHEMPTAATSARARGDLAGVFKQWEAKVRDHYYDV